MRDPFHIGVVLRFTKTWRASHSFIHSNVVIKKSLTGAVSISNAFTIYAVSFRVPFSLYTVGFRIPSVLLFHRPVFYILPYRQPFGIMTDGTLPAVSLLFITDILSLSVAPYSIFPSVAFILTVYRVHFCRCLCISFDQGGRSLVGCLELPRI